MGTSHVRLPRFRGRLSCSLFPIKCQNSNHPSSRIRVIPLSDFDVNQILREAVPQWTQADFLFLESQPWWAPSVQAELARTDTAKIQPCFGRPASVVGMTTEYRCHSVPSTGRIHDQIQTGPATGIVLLAERQMRDCLLLLGRLRRLCRPHPPVLLVIPRNAVSLMPLLMESGAGAVMVQAVTDIQVAEWCRRVTGSVA